jgi:hypothetical protein
MLRRPAPRNALLREAPYEVGKRYPVQRPHAPTADDPRSVETVAHIMVTAIRLQLLQDVSEADAKAEGYRTRARFLEAFTQEYGQLKSGRQVWVVEFELVEGPARLLTRPIPGKRGDYSSGGDYVIDAGEAPPETWRDPGRNQARQRHQEVRRDEERRRAGSSIVQQIRSEVVAADRAGVDIAAELAEIHRQVEGIRRKRRDAA